MAVVEAVQRAGAVARRMARGVTLARQGAFVTSVPSAQTAVDAVPDEWASSLPPPLSAVRAGEATLFDDPRIHWAFERIGGVAGASVLDLGPLEGGHSYMAERAGAAEVVGVEANSKAYLKCLVTKELLGLNRCSFLCGEVTAYLRATEQPVDVCIACGILYHMVNPVELIDLISRRATHLVMWTHVYTDEALQNPQLARRLGPPRQASYEGFDYEAVRHSYSIDSRLSGFFGGTAAYSNWMTRASLMKALERFGWGAVEIAFDEPFHPNGPSLALIATKNGDASVTADRSTI